MASKPAKRRIPRPVYFETTIPVVRTCMRCGVWFAAGVAEGLKAEVEFVALDWSQQMWAVLNHIELYCIRRIGLIHLDRTRLSDPIGAVYPQHRCDVVWPRPAGVQVRIPRRSDAIPF